MIGTMVYVKFGEHHGKKAQVIGQATKSGLPAFILRLDDGTVFEKKQKNTIKVIDR
ncbi:hypothetical protein [Priestia megaterium]|uniref:hypothetical protein n=1 Tax=Priestia megaterium TaxID=1404 RepID=UPI0023DC6C46|nr:hypothetical protein [Priestia megaterium]MDF2010180.1 hypothetical protein [Priestia megaterium]